VCPPDVPLALQDARGGAARAVQGGAGYALAPHHAHHRAGREAALDSRATKTRYDCSRVGEILDAITMAKLSTASIPQDQKFFGHANNMILERFAVSLFGKKYDKSADRLDIGFWKTFYLAAFEVLDNSIFSSIGSIDKSHKQAIQRR